MTPSFMDEDMFQINNLSQFIQLVDMAWILNSIFFVNNSKHNYVLDFFGENTFSEKCCLDTFFPFHSYLHQLLFTCMNLSHFFFAILIARSLLPLTYPVPSKVLISLVFIIDPHSLDCNCSFSAQSPLLLLLFPTRNLQLQTRQ